MWLPLCHQRKRRRTGGGDGRRGHLHTDTPGSLHSHLRVRRRKAKSPAVCRLRDRVVEGEKGPVNMPSRKAGEEKEGGVVTVVMEDEGQQREQTRKAGTRDTLQRRGAAGSGQHLRTACSQRLGTKHQRGQDAVPLPGVHPPHSQKGTKIQVQGWSPHTYDTTKLETSPKPQKEGLLK